ncbi:pimeloyl-ACP methyl ester carboxylesterase [Microbacterium sp. AG1240]|uniref:epoxide hydrolase family protein n=1 Tax=Microbacterium sp. AG1240 TaxID=2183992 RepID=UPI000EB27947|nr:epoxide hydrolase family protein [Microbacterium sp. AG1240]RKT36560.1 pimeloyl-ACP methyl ester carboxylesterase [Microbacterium sp. AG1240]
MSALARVSNVSAADVSELRDRLRNTRWAPRWPLDGWAAGTDEAELRRLVAYWADGYDWEAHEREINALPWAEVVLDGVPLRYLRFDAETVGALPVILTNGWPSTAVELVDLARHLSAPSEYGGDAADAVTVIVPALPGFPFSPQRPSHDDQTHELWHRLMRDCLGFDRYAAHGGDLGAGITSRLAQAHPESVVAIHLLAVASPLSFDPDTLSAAERAYLASADRWHDEEGGYEHEQQTRPLSLAPALSDSPAGLLAWIVEKYRAWSDCDGVLSSRFSDDVLLTQASLYWFSNSISTSFRPYWEFATGRTSRVAPVPVATAVAVFPFDLTQPPREWAERTYDVVRYTRMPRGGHFAPHEEPALLADDLREFLRPLR